MHRFRVRGNFTATASSKGPQASNPADGLAVFLPGSYHRSIQESKIRTDVCKRTLLALLPVVVDRPCTSDSFFFYYYYDYHNWTASDHGAVVPSRTGRVEPQPMASRVA